MESEKKVRNQQKRSFKTHRFTNPSRTNTTPPGNFYLENLAKMEMMLNPSYPYPYPISSSSSLPPLNTQYSINRFQQPPLLPLSRAAFSSSSSSFSFSSSSSEFNNQKYTKQALNPPQKFSTSKVKKYPDLKPGHDSRAKRWGPNPKSEKRKDDVIDEMKFCESLIYAMSPSPSSLPMPKFAILKPKLTH